jgi:hypothetical protein
MRFKKTIFFTLAITAIIIFSGCSEIDKTKSIIMERTTEEARIDFKANLIKNTIEGAFAKELTDSTENKWQGAIWGMQLSQYRSSLVDSAIYSAISQINNYSVAMQRSLLEVAFSMYEGAFIREVQTSLPKFNNAKLLAMAIEYLMLVQNKKSIAEHQSFMQERFPNWKSNPMLFMLNNRIDEKLGKRYYSLPPIKDLLKHSLHPDYITVYSFYRKNRDYIGQTIFRKKDGTFLRNNSNELIAVPQFSRSVTNLPSYLTNGNTPQGIYSFNEMYISENVFIGPSQTIRTVMPFESTKNDFLREDNINSIWTVNDYKSLLPQSWQNYLPIFDSYYAGKSGRTDIVAHGTTINPEYYKEFSFYPYTPSLGCFTTKELWSLETGGLIESDQQKLIDIILSLNTTAGYWIIIELNERESNMTIEEIEKLFE